MPDAEFIIIFDLGKPMEPDSEDS
ncbi:hypothetical protein LYNGBM3L_41050 [Moorena producens 3L]|nr:hypothetical protein LYNGBM3L_41050 [Moorena producens 3L]